MSTPEGCEALAGLDWIVAGAALCRYRGETSDLAFLTSLLRTLHSELPGCPPTGFLLDIASLLRDVRQRRTLVGPFPHTLRLYEDLVLGRLMTDPLCEALVDAYATLPARLQPLGVVLFVEQLLSRVGLVELPGLNRQSVVALSKLTEQDWVDRWDQGEDRGRGFEPVYVALIAGAGRCARLILPEDVVLLERLPRLRRRSDRLAFVQLTTAASALCARVPAVWRGSARRGGEQSTQISAENTYPVGGFSSISTRGSVENLLPSELALMEEGRELDLFDVRYAEGELLFYTRDEATFYRARRTIAVVLSGAIQGLRFRDPGVPFQRRTLVMGVVVALVEQLVRSLGDVALLIRVVPTEPLEEVVALLDVALQPWIESGIVVMGPGYAWIEKELRRGSVDVVQIAPHRGRLCDVEGVHESWLCCGSRPSFEGSFTEPTLPEDPWEAWREVVPCLLDELM